MALMVDKVELLNPIQVADFGADRAMAGALGVAHVFKEGFPRRLWLLVGGGSLAVMTIKRV